MSTKSKIEQKISSIKKYIKQSKLFAEYTKEEIIDNPILLWSLERCLYLIVQNAIDLAEVVVAYKKWSRVISMSDGFIILHDNKVISKKLKEKMIMMTGFRNALAHGYEKIDYSIVFEVLQNGLKDVQELIKNIESKI